MYCDFIGFSLAFVNFVRIHLARINRYLEMLILIIHAKHPNITFENLTIQGNLPIQIESLHSIS